MTPRERFLAALAGRPVDRVPIQLLHLQYATPEQLAAVEDPFRREIAARVFDQQHARVDVGLPGNRYLMIPPETKRETTRQSGGDEITEGRIDTPRGPLT